MNYLRIDLKELKQQKYLKDVPFKLGKCFYCGGKSKLGTHDNCWKVFKGYMVDDKVTIQPKLDESYDSYSPNGQTYKDNAGRSIVQGRVMPSDTSFND